MQDLYKKVKKLTLSDWVPTRVFLYTSGVKDKIFEYDTFTFNGKRGDPYIKELFDHFLQMIEIMTGKDVNDNKIVIEIKNIYTGHTNYIGQYDARYSVGTGYWTEFGMYKKISLTTEKEENNTLH